MQFFVRQQLSGCTSWSSCICVSLIITTNLCIIVLSVHYGIFMTTCAYAWKVIIVYQYSFFISVFRTSPSKDAKRNLAEHCHVFRNEPDSKRDIQNLGFLSLKRRAPKLSILGELRRCYDLSANIFITKCAIDRRKNKLRSEPQMWWTLAHEWLRLCLSFLPTLCNFYRSQLPCVADVSC